MHASGPAPPAVAVLIPCLDEEATIAAVVTGFRRALPEAAIYVYDNDSSDDTARVAAEAGAVVRHEPRAGKGQVIRRMFGDVEADAYVLVDGDATYDPDSAAAMLEKLFDEQLDMVVGTRVGDGEGTYRAGHRFGNRLLTGVLGSLFERQFTDILSGYRVFSRRFVKSFPALAQGFETETELTVHALELRMPVGEVETPYAARPSGSTSKLSTYRDGFRILGAMVRLHRTERPLQFFGVVAAVLAVVSIILAVPLVDTYVDTGEVPRFPTAILCASLMVLAALSMVTGLVLQTVTRGRHEVRRLAYLSIPGPAHHRD